MKTLHTVLSLGLILIAACAEANAAALWSQNFNADGAFSAYV